MLKIFNDHKLLLVVDDDSDYIHNFEELLSNTNLPVKLDHVDKLPKHEVVLKNQYDIVFLDLVMNTASQEKIFALCKKLSAHVPVIMVSPNEDKLLITKSIDSGSHAFISKDNLNTRCLVHTISKALERFGVDEDDLSDKFSQIKSVLKGLEKKFKVGVAKECRSCSHAECRLNEAIHRLKLMA